jgi:arylsulfatase A-like enzyme
VRAGLIGAAAYAAVYLLVAAQQWNRYVHPAGMDLALAGIAPRHALDLLVRALWPVLVTTNAVLLLFHVVVGFGLGACAGGVWDRLRRARGRRARGPVRDLQVVATVMAVAALAFATVAVRYPYQYDHLLNPGGGRRPWIGQALTATASPTVLEGALWAAIAAVVLPAVARGARRRPAIGLALAVAAIVAVPGWHRPARALGDNRGPNVVLILLESARPDYFSVNGYPRPTAPHLERLIGAHGVTFTNAWAHANGTVASVVTLLTSTYAPRHGMRSMFHSEAFVRPGLATLPAVLQAHGYATRVATDWDGDVTYFNHRVLPGFDQYDVSEFGVVNYVKQIYAQHFVFLALTDNAVGHRLFATFYRAGGGFAPGTGAAYYRARIARHLSELAGSPRFFLTVFFADTHINYRCPHPYYERFTDRAYLGPNKYQARSNPQAPTGAAADARQIVGLYAGCVSALDDNVGFVAAELRRLGLADRTILVLTGDHGERLPDHRSFRYGRNGAWLDPAEFRVPLMIVAPDLDPVRRRVGATARHVDVMPTILDLVGVPAPPGLAGVSLRPAFTEVAADRAVDVFAETGFHWTPVAPPYLGYPPMTEVVELRLDRGGSLIPRYFLRPACLARIELARHRFIRSGRWHLNHRPTVTGSLVELYDWMVDPELEHNVAGQRPEVTAALRARLLAWALAAPDLVLRGGELAPRDPAARDRCARATP